MPDLGKYSTEVLSAYVLTVLLIVGISALTWARSRAVRRALDIAEERRKQNG